MIMEQAATPTFGHLLGAFEMETPARNRGYRWGGFQTLPLSAIQYLCWRASRSVERIAYEEGKGGRVAVRSQAMQLQGATF